MPRKFRRYVAKGYSRKGLKVKTSKADLLVDSGVQTDLHFNPDEDMLHLKTEILQETVAVQTDIIVNSKSIETQTEVVEIQDAEIQVSELDEMRLCVGNNDEKFLPLVTKHKGLFKDVTGLYI